MAYKDLTITLHETLTFGKQIQSRAKRFEPDTLIGSTEEIRQRLSRMTYGMYEL